MDGAAKLLAETGVGLSVVEVEIVVSEVVKLVFGEARFQGISHQRMGRVLSCLMMKGMVSWLSSQADGSVYMFQVLPVRVIGWIWVPRCFPTRSILSMRSGTCDVPRFLGVRRFVQLCILLRYQLDQVVVSRSLDHVFRFPCREREGRRGRHRVFSRWMVGGDGR